MSFEVIPSTVPVTTDEWLRAKNLPITELPPLDDRQLLSAKQLRVGEENYRRFHVYLRHQVRERQRRQGEAFGRVVEEMIKPLGGGFSVAKVSRVAPPDAWKVVIRDQDGGMVDFWSLFEVVEALIEGTAASADVAYFRSQLWAKLGQEVSVGVTG
jgi:hypothetical protein